MVQVAPLAVAVQSDDAGVKTVPDGAFVVIVSTT
jgi:hypothetical protein